MKVIKAFLGSKSSRYPLHVDRNTTYDQKEALERVVRVANRSRNDLQT